MSGTNFSFEIDKAIKLIFSIFYNEKICRILG